MDSDEDEVGDDSVEWADSYEDDHSLFALVLLDPSDPQRNARVARTWLERGWGELFAEVANAVSVRDPHADATVVACATDRDPIRAVRRTPKRWERALELLDTNPVLVSLGGSIQGKQAAYSDVRLAVSRVVDNNPWVSLVIRAMLGQTFDPAVEYDRWVDFLASVLDAADPAYADVIDDGGSEDGTELDSALNRRRKESNEQSREVLRGYAWVTVVPRESVERLGGADAIEASGAVAELRRLSAGGVLLRATRTPQEYDGAAMKRLFQLLAPVLPAGQPRDMPGRSTRHRVVYENAADYR